MSQFYSNTPILVLETLNKFVGSEFECKNGKVTEVEGSRRPLPERPKENSLGRFCEAEKQIYRNLIADADIERLNYLISLFPSELLYSEAQRREMECKKVLATVKQAIGCL